jgi:hypothetical protein
LSLLGGQLKKYLNARDWRPNRQNPETFVSYAQHRFNKIVAARKKARTSNARRQTNAAWQKAINNLQSYDWGIDPKNRALKSFLQTLDAFHKDRELSAEYLREKYGIEIRPPNPTAKDSAEIVGGLQVVNAKYDLDASRFDPAAFIKGAKKSFLE